MALYLSMAMATRLNVEMLTEIPARSKYQFIRKHFTIKFGVNDYDSIRLLQIYHLIS